MRIIMARCASLVLAISLSLSFAAYTPYHVAKRLSPSLAWHPASKEAQATLSSIQIGKGKALAIKAFFPAGAAGEIASDETSTKGWDHAAGVGLLLQPDGTSRYVDFALIDAGTGEAFKHGLSMRDPSCHQVFVPFALLVNSSNKAFSPAEHPRVRLAWSCSKQPDAQLSFKAGDFSVGSLDDGESAWPASALPHSMMPLYLETFDNASDCRTGGMATFSFSMTGPPKTNIPRSLAVSLGSADAQCQWDFPDASRWRYFDGMTIWLKMGAPNGRIELVIAAKNANEERRFVRDIPAQGKEWAAFHIGWGDFIDQQGRGFEPGEFTTASLVLRASPGAVFPVNVAVGPFRLDYK